MDINQYERYLVYDEPIPYISKRYIVKRQEIEKEINLLKSTSNINEEQKIKLSQLQEEYEKLLILIYPVRMTDYINFYFAVNCLAIDKNKIPNPKFISMSYLDFIFHLIKNDEQGSLYTQMLVEIFRLCLKIDNIKYLTDEKNKIKLILKDIEYDKNDFDEIRKIICYQNMPDFDETYIDPKVEQVLKEAEEFVNRHKKKMASLEDQIVCVMLALHETDEKRIHNLTIRKFSKLLQRYDYKLHYEIYKTAELSGMVSFKQDIDHWMTEISKNKYSDVIVEYGELKNKIENAKV